MKGSVAVCCSTTSSKFTTTVLNGPAWLTPTTVGGVLSEVKRTDASRLSISPTELLTRQKYFRVTVSGDSLVICNDDEVAPSIGLPSTNH